MKMPKLGPDEVAVGDWESLVTGKPRILNIAHLKQTPRFASLKTAAIHYGTSRSTLYRRAAEGHIRLIRHGSRTMVDMRSAEEFFDNLPEVKLRCSSKKKD